MPRIRIPVSPLRRGVVATALGLAAMTAIVGSSAGSAASPFRAGDPGREGRAIGGPDGVAVIARAARSAAALGLPAAARRTADHITDRFDSTEYDEVTESDATGHLTALQRFDASGRLVAAVRFGWTGDGGRPLPNEEAARARATALAVATLGSPPDGALRVVRGPAGSGWTVAWERRAGGLPVRGDGLRIQLWDDGSIHGLSRNERPLAAAPESQIDDATARAAVEAQLDRWFSGSDRTDVAISDVALAWTAPNDTFAPERPDAPGPVLRLAWVVTVATSGSLAERLGGLELDIDAGDGTLIGGDVIR